jgi:hypothetical protein
MSSKNITRHGSRQNADKSGGKLPPIPMSESLCDALFAEAGEAFRSPRDQALVILEWYFELFPYHPTSLLCAPHEVTGKSKEIDRALSEIERLSEGGE